MSTAEQLDLTDEALFTDSLIRTVAAALALRGRKPREAWAHLGISKGTWYNRMDDGHFTAYQMQRLADWLEVDVTDLYDGLGVSVRSRCFSPLTLIHGGKDGHLFDPDTFAPAVEVSPERPTLTLVQG
jgi:hypothetical protein